MKASVAQRFSCRQAHASYQVYPDQEDGPEKEGEVSSELNVSEEALRSALPQENVIQSKVYPGGYHKEGNDAFNHGISVGTYTQVSMQESSGRHGAEGGDQRPEK
ncbi:MAG: hypothetical protein DDT27_01487 [Dehalococcoidia bacterium]|nr:hypothetical protein [Chloroflexota bacterium]